MSWLDTSYSFARTAFSHAQKSIDKVLDISEERKEDEGGVLTDSRRQAASTSPPSPPKETSKKSDSISSTWEGSDSFDAFFKWTADSPSTDTPAKSVSRSPNTIQKPVSGRSAQSRPRFNRSSAQQQSKKPPSSPIQSTSVKNEGVESMPDRKSPKQANESPLTSTPIAEAGLKRIVTLSTSDGTTVLPSDTGMKTAAAGGKQPATRPPSTLVGQDWDKSLELVQVESVRDQHNQSAEPESVNTTHTTEIVSAPTTVSTHVDPTALTSTANKINTVSATRMSTGSPPDTSTTSSEAAPKADTGSVYIKENTAKVNQAESQQMGLSALPRQVPTPDTEVLLLSSDHAHLPSDSVTSLSLPQQDLLELALSEQEDYEHELDDRTVGLGENVSLVTERNSRSWRETGINVAIEPLQVKSAIANAAVLEADEPAVLPPLTPDRLKSPSPPIQEHLLQSPLMTLEQDEPLVAAEQREGMTSGQSTVDLNERKVDDRVVSIPPVENENVKVEKIQEELQRVQKILNVRESKLLQMSQESIDLHDANQELQRQVHELQKLSQSRGEELETLQEQSTRKITTAEKKLQAVLKERDSLKKQVHVLESQHSQHNDSVELKYSELIKEKDEQIAGLMEEGEALSKKQLQSSNIIKKLRAKEKEKEQVLTALNQQISDQESEVKRLKELVQKKEENEKKYQESLSQLNAIAEQQDKELRQLKPEKEDLQERARSLQSNLDNAYKELTEMRKSSALSQSVAHEAALSAHQSAKDELKQVMEEQRLQLQREKDSLVIQISDLQMSLSRAEQQSSWREDQLRQEITDLQQRLQEADARNQDLSNSISEATRPLLRQIEHIQSAHTAQALNWEKVETSLTQRLVDAQTQLSIASEKERSVQEREMTFQSRVGVLEAQLGSLRQEKSQLVAAFELEKTKLQALKEEQQRDVARHEALRSSLLQKLEETKREKDMLERQLEYERVRLEAESKKATLELQEKERLKNQLAHSLTSVMQRSLSNTSSHHDEIPLDRSPSVNEGSVNEGSLYGRNTSLGSASIIEQLQSLLKQREGELANSQSMVHSLERSLSVMTEELANVSAKSETLQSKVESIPFLSQQLQEVQRKYEAMLQMYGEKAEEAEELRFDIQDLKTMYRQQIEDLVSQR